MRLSGSLCALLLATTAAAFPSGAVDRALEDVRAEPGIQRSYPAAVDLGKDGSAKAAFDPLMALLRWLGLGGAAAKLIRLLGAGTAIVAVLLGAVWLARRLGEHQDLDSAREIAGSAPLDAGPLLDAQALAAEGRFGEAIHLLLLRTFEVLARRMGSRLAPGMTAREALLRLTLPPPAHPALTDLVDAVETTTFAGRNASEADYLRCAARFTTLQSVLAGARG